MEKLIQFLASLPRRSPTQTLVTDGLIGNLWSILLHPPLSFVGDLYQYRQADGGFNVSPDPALCSEMLEYHVPTSWKGRQSLCEERQACRCSACCASRPWFAFRQYFSYFNAHLTVQLCLPASNINHIPTKSVACFSTLQPLSFMVI